MIFNREIENENYLTRGWKTCGLLSGIFITGLLCLSVELYASASEVPLAISYQGVATRNDATRTPLPAAVYSNVIVRIKDAPDDGSVLWGRQMAVTVGDGGFFNMILSDPDYGDPQQVDELAPAGVSLSDVFTVLDASQRYFSFNVDGFEFTPLQQFNTTPYAVTAQSARHALGDFDVYGALDCCIGTEALGGIDIRADLALSGQMEVESGSSFRCNGDVEVAGYFVASNSAPVFKGPVVFTNSLVCQGALSASNICAHALKVTGGGLMPGETTAFGSYEAVISGFENATEVEEGAFLDNDINQSVVIESCNTDYLLVAATVTKGKGNVVFKVIDSGGTKLYDAVELNQKDHHLWHTVMLPVPKGCRVQLDCNDEGDGSAEAIVSRVYRVNIGADVACDWNFDQVAPVLPANAVSSLSSNKVAVSSSEVNKTVGESCKEDPIIPDSMTYQCLLFGENNEKIVNKPVEVQVSVFSGSGADEKELWKEEVDAYANDKGLITFVMDGADDSGERFWHHAFINTNSTASDPERVLSVKLLKADGVAVEGTTSVRQRLVSTPYAFAAEQVAGVADNFYVAGDLSVQGTADLGGFTASNLSVNSGIQVGSFMENRGTLTAHGSEFRVAGSAVFYNGAEIRNASSVSSNLFALNGDQDIGILQPGSAGMRVDPEHEASFWQDDETDGDAGSDSSKSYGWSYRNDTPSSEGEFDLRDEFGPGDGFFMVRARLKNTSMKFKIYNAQGEEETESLKMGINYSDHYSSVVTLPVPDGYNLKFSRSDNVTSCDVFWLPLRREKR